MLIEYNKSLKLLNTFGLESIAHSFAAFSTEDELRNLLACQPLPTLILGGGSNMLLPANLDRFVLRNQIAGITISEDNSSEVVIRVGAGEVWHDLVTWAVTNGYSGIENLALIPGTVGAAPIQNIGAYGVELKDVFEHLEAVPRHGGGRKVFNLEECAFGYRDSIFKRAEKEKWVITYVSFRLQKKHQLSLDYGDIRQMLASRGIPNPNIRDVFQAVIDIRRSKLPDPAQVGNAGSFFKNPVISTAHYNDLKRTFPDLTGYPVSDEAMKVPAGWLIDRAGWKGYRQGEAGIHDRQALVLVNYGSATSSELVALAHQVSEDIKRRFGIVLETEVNILTS